MRHTTLPAVLLLAALTACGSSDTSKPDDAKASRTPSKTATPTTEAPADDAPTTSADEAYKEAQEDFEQTLKDLEGALGETVGIHPGTYSVTEDSPDYEDVSLALDDEYIVPGIYTTKGPADGSSGCYWARLEDASGQSSSIIANDYTPGRAVVSLKEGEFFKTSGCKPWTKTGD